MLRNMPTVSRDQQIRDEFDRVGSMSTNAFAHHLRDTGFYAEDELIGFQISHIQSEARKALKKHDATGLPFAGQTCKRDDDGAGVWMTRMLWGFEDYALNVGELIAQRDTLHWEAAKLCDECRERFGHAPAIPPIGGLSVAAD